VVNSVPPTTFNFSVAALTVGRSSTPHLVRNRARRSGPIDRNNQPGCGVAAPGMRVFVRRLFAIVVTLDCLLEIQNCSLAFADGRLDAFPAITTG